MSDKKDPSIPTYDVMVNKVFTQQGLTSFVEAFSSFYQALANRETDHPHDEVPIGHFHNNTGIIRRDSTGIYFLSCPEMRDLCEVLGCDLDNPEINLAKVDDVIIATYFAENDTDLPFYDQNGMFVKTKFRPTTA